MQALAEVAHRTGEATRKRESTMRVPRLVVMLAALATLGSADPTDTSFASAQKPLGGCHDDCSSDCSERYPGDADMANFCIRSCVASQCGGADWP
jgi:hypothetical protein